MSEVVFFSRGFKIYNFIGDLFNQMFHSIFDKSKNEVDFWAHS